MRQKSFYTVTVNGAVYAVEVQCTDPIIPQRYLPSRILEIGRPAPWVTPRRMDRRIRVKRRYS